MRFLVLDLEAVRDHRVWKTPEPPAEARVEMWQVHDGTRLEGRITDPPRDHFAPPYAWRPICVGCALFETAYDQPPALRKLGVIEAPADATIEERERFVLTRFAEYFSRDAVDLVTWNGREFDLPVLALRSMRAGISWPRYYQGRDFRYRFSEEGHLDLQDHLSDTGALRQRLSLDGMSKLIGLPGKLDGVTGSSVEEYFAAGKLAEISAYCLADVVQTSFLWLRWQLLKGAMKLSVYRAAAKSLAAACEAEPRVAAVVNQADRRTLFLEDAAEPPAPSPLVQPPIDPEPAF